MASSSYNPYVTEKVGEEYTYPYPSNLSPTSFTSVKLSGRDNYRMWKTQMLCLLRSHGMFGFTDETPVVSRQTSVSGKETVSSPHWLWTRSNDTVIKGWILGSLSEEPLKYVLDSLRGKPHQQTDASFTAKDVWDELKTIYGPPDKHEEEQRSYDQNELYNAVKEEDWETADELLTDRKNFNVSVVDSIANNGNTALHVAVGNMKDVEFFMKLLERTPDNIQLDDVRNLEGSTLLHVAAMFGDVEVAEILVGKNLNLLFTEDNNCRLPLSIALLNVDDKMSQFLYNRMIIYKDWITILSSIYGDDLLVILISSKRFGEAKKWLDPFTKDTYHSDAVLMAIAQNFPSELNTLEKYIVSYVKGTDIISNRVKSVLKTASDYMDKSCVPLCGSWVQGIFGLFTTGIYWIVMLFPLILKMLVWSFVKERVGTHDDAIKVLSWVCFKIDSLEQPIPTHQYYVNPILEATSQNAYEVVERIVNKFPSAISSTDEDGHNIIQCAVINRSENVYNVIYQMRKHKNIYKTIKDSSHNNLLHLAARLAPPSKLNLISGAALQVQRELQWFEEVERFGSPLNITQKNSFGETPQMVFTREHKDLVIEGEKWIKATAESYTITAALITTIVFAAAITVPGGNNQDTGIPLFTNSLAFTIFAISDAISLFTAVTSLLIFLSILTTRFAQQDFLYKLPTKLIIGLAALFISTTAMIVAFSATLYIVFGQGNSRVLIPIVVLTSLPITSFVTLQFPLIKDLMSATYGRSIFGKKRDEPFY